MNNYINNKNEYNIMKYFNLILIFILCMFSSYSADITIYNNETGLGGNQVESGNPLYLDFSNTSTSIIFSAVFILLLLSYIFIIHPVNSLALTFLSIMLMANGFNVLISFILMLISIILITISTKK